jgi:hypothetical protein
MPGINYYLLSALPGLGELSSMPPLSREELLEHVTGNSDAIKILESLFLGDDLLQRQASLAGQEDELELVVLSVQQARDEQPLPEFLSPAASEITRRIPEDDIWANYYRWAARLAKKTVSSFLRRWIGHEVSLKNALVVARAKELELDPSDYLVANELSDPDADFTSLINEWAQASNPLQGERILDEARWKWLKDNDMWFTFQNDELAAYAAKLMLLWRWHRLNRAGQQETNNG